MKLIKSIFLIAIMPLFFACGGGKYAATNKIYREKVKMFAKTIQKIPDVKSPTALNKQAVAIPSEWVGTVNLNLRKPNLVVLHYTAQDSLNQTINTFIKERTQVSAHYIVGKKGEVVQMLNDYLRAWHAGVGKWGNNTDLNSGSIGVEIDNNGKDPFTDAQINSLLVLLDTLKTRYNIPVANFIGHSDLAPGRKTDPGKLFPWKLLASKGFGYWYDEAVVEVPANFDPKMALKIIGYDVTKYDIALKAFKLHFFPEDISESDVLDAEQLALLFNLYQKY